MANVTPDPDELYRFFKTLYSACDDGWLILSYPSARRMNEKGNLKLESIGICILPFAKLL